MKRYYNEKDVIMKKMSYKNIHEYKDIIQDIYRYHKKKSLLKDFINHKNLLYKTPPNMIVNINHDS